MPTAPSITSELAPPPHQSPRGTEAPVGGGRNPPEQELGRQRALPEKPSAITHPLRHLTGMLVPPREARRAGAAPVYRLRSGSQD